MSSTPAVTVLMPAYNAGRYIHEAVESVLAQTFTDFQFLIINDGSTDNTADILASFSDPRIEIISRPNKGLIASLNEGLAAACAPFVARMDADDVCLPGRLQVQLDFMLAHPQHVLLGSDVVYTDREGRPIMRINAGGYADAELRGNFYTKCPFFHPSVMFRKELVLAVGGYPAGALLFEDWLLWKAVMERGQAEVVPEVLVNMRLNPESVTIDEKWRGPEFAAIRLRSLQQGYVTEEDAQRLEEIVRSQDFRKFKEASYYVLVGKKYLWDNPQPQLARDAFVAALRHYPAQLSTWVLLAASFLPAGWMKGLYRRAKKSSSAAS
jgi:glycosyltransferase involved in cell wall biosynthesis